MGITVIAFIALLIAVAFLRILELRVSQRHRRQLLTQGASKVSEPQFRWMVAIHTVVLISAALEVVLLHRPFIPWMGFTMLAVFIAANLVRLWVVRTMGTHWNVQVMNSTGLGVVTSGPFRFVRHPNYTAVFVEMFSLPLIHTAWITAIIGFVGYAAAVSQRIAVEESVLLANPAYRTAMAGKPRFLPGLF